MQTRLITPQQVIKNLKSRMDKLREQGIEPTVDNLNTDFIRRFRERLKEDNNE